MRRHLSELRGLSIIALATLAAPVAHAQSGAATVFVSGCVVDTAGQPRSRADLRIEGDHYGYSNAADATDEQGRFRIEVARGTPAQPKSVTLRAYEAWGAAPGGAGQSAPVTVSNSGADVTVSRCLVVAGWQVVQATFIAPEWDSRSGGSCASGYCPTDVVTLRLDCDERPCPMRAAAELNRPQWVQPFSDGVRAERLGEGLQYRISIEQQPKGGHYECTLAGATSGTLSLDRAAELGQPPRNLAEVTCRLTAKGEEERRRRVEAKLAADAAYKAELERQLREDAARRLPRRGGGDATALLGQSVAYANKDPAAQAAEQQAKQQRMAQASAALAAGSSQYVTGVTQQVVQAVAAPGAPAAGGTMAGGSATGEEWRGDNGVTVWLSWRADGFDSTGTATARPAFFAKISADTYRYDEPPNHCTARFLTAQRMEYACNGQLLAIFKKVP